MALEKGGWGILSSDILERSTVRGFGGGFQRLLALLEKKWGKEK
jgi:hypothetical protein